MSQLYINVLPMGEKKDSCAWLNRGLASGELVLKEGFKENGAHALWLKGDNFSQLLAVNSAHGYVAYVQGEGCSVHPYTSACWLKMKEIAQDWCYRMEAEFGCKR